MASKLTRVKEVPTTCNHCGAPLPSAEEQGAKPGTISYYCTPIRVYHPDGSLWMKIPTACERDRAALRHVLALEPADLTAEAAEVMVRKMVAWVQRTREHHLLPGSKRRTKMLAEGKSVPIFDEAP